MKSTEEYVPAMTPPEVHEYLYTLGTAWTYGTVVEFGSWLGASAVSVLSGLLEADYNLPFYAYDEWKADSAEVVNAGRFDLKIAKGQDIKPLFMKNVRSVYNNIVAKKGLIQNTLTKWEGGPISICILDAPRRNPTFQHVIEQVGPYWVPNMTVVAFLDYYAYRSRHKVKQAADRHALRVPVRFTTTYERSFSLMKEWPEENSCVFFLYTGGINWKTVTFN